MFELRQLAKKLEKLEKMLSTISQSAGNNIQPLGIAQQGEPLTSQVHWINVLPFKDDDEMMTAEQLLEDGSKIQLLLSFLLLRLYRVFLLHCYKFIILNNYTL